MSSRHGVFRRIPVIDRRARKATSILPRKWRLSLSVERLEDRLVPSTTVEIEPNNLLSQGTSLTFTESPSGFHSALGTVALTPGSDVDYWRFAAEAGDPVSIAGVGWA